LHSAQSRRQRSINVSREKIRAKKERKVSVKKYNVPHHGLGGSRHEKRKEELLRTNHTEQYSKGQYMRQICLHFLAYTRTNSAIASGATPIGSAGRTPDRKKSTEERWKIEANDKEPTGRQVV
jgi:hypothetical protein